jgi:hypothetical protein
MSKLMLLVMLLLPACGSQDMLERINLCNQLPTVSEKDTDQTIVEVDNFNAKYEALYCNAK